MFSRKFLLGRKDQQNGIVVCLYSCFKGRIKIAIVKFLVYMVVLLLNLFFLSGKEEKVIRYVDVSSVNGELARVLPVYVNLRDTVSGDTLYLEFTNQGLPRSAYRKISTGVCIDGECRRLQISVYWDLTGRYLGFELPAGEFLSKSGHRPFSSEEYQRLHVLLANRYSALANYKLEELVHVENASSGEVDAVSSATVKEVLGSVVDGAVYTCYALWHIVYGNSQREVQKLALQYFSEELAMQLLASADSETRIWALNHLGKLGLWSGELEQNVLRLIGSRNYYLAERAISSFPQNMIDSPVLQKKIVALFETSEYQVKRLLALKLMNATVLSDELKNGLAASLPNYRGPLALNVLDLFIRHRVNDVPTCLQIAKLLDGEDKLLAKKAFDYLSQLSLGDRQIKKQLKSFRSE